MTRKNRLKENKGFTMAELLTGVAIIAVTASVGILALGNTKKDKTAMANDDIAMQIYIAAQNRLLQMKSYGEWSVITKDHLLYPQEDKGYYEENVAEYYGQKLTDIPSDYEYWKTQTGYKGESGWEDIRFLSTEELESGGNGEFLKELLPAGTFEDSVRHYLIEYNPVTATVYGVFYAEKPFTEADLISKGQYYGTPSDNGRPVGSNQTAARNLRKEFSDTIVLGYFGGGMVNDVPYEDMPMPEVIVYNGEDLVLHIENGKAAVSGLSFTVTGEKSRTKKEYRVVLNPELAANSTAKPYCLRTTVTGVGEQYLYLVADCEDNASSVDIVLDSLGTVNNGMNMTEFRFHKNFPDFYPGEDLEITVKVTPTESIGLPGVRTVKTNSLFASVSPVEKKTDGTNDVFSGGIEINALRHLMNLNKNTSGVELTQTYNPTGMAEEPIFPYKGAGVPFRRAYLSANISADGKGEGLLPFMPIASRTYGATAYTPIDIAFSDNMEQFILSGKKDDSQADAYRIYDLAISNKTGNVGLFGTVSKGADYKGTGELVIRDLGIVQAVGGTETCFAISDAKKDTNIGAFVGSSACNTTIVNCYSTVLLNLGSVRAGKDFNMGGLAGRVSGKLTVSNSYVSGRTSGGRYESALSTDGCNISFDFSSNNTVNIGGLVGYVPGVCDISSSYCVASIGSRQSQMTTGTYRIGGLVGCAENALTLTDSYFYAPVDIPDLDGMGSNASEISLGGLIGLGDGSYTATGCSYIEEYLAFSDIVKTLNGKKARISEKDVTADTDMVIEGCFETDSEVKTYNYTFGFVDTDTNAAPVDVNEHYRVRDVSNNITGGMMPFAGVPTTAKDASFRTEEYDSYLTVAYPYPDVTGLKHHFGDWSTALPTATITLKTGIGVETLTKPADVEIGGVTKSWEEGSDGTWCLKGVTPGTSLDIAAVTKDKLVLKQGYEGMACSRSYGKIDRTGTDWTYTVKGNDAVIQVHAGAVKPFHLYCPDATEANTQDPDSGVRHEPEATENGNYRRVFGRADVPMKVCFAETEVIAENPAVLQEYDSSITLCFIWREKDENDTYYTSSVSTPSVAAKYKNMCNVDSVTSPACTFYANLQGTNGNRSDGMLSDMDMEQFAEVGAAGENTHFLRSDGDPAEEKPVTGQTVLVKKRAYYGNRQYVVRAYAYVTELDGTDVRMVNWLRTGLSDPLELSVALNRVPVSFIYEADDSEWENGVTAAKNMFGKYRITVDNTTTSAYTFPTDENRDTEITYYVEYEDGTTGNLKLYENNGITSTGSSCMADPGNLSQQYAAKKIPVAEFFDSGDPGRLGNVFRGWQDAGTTTGTLDCSDWNWPEFDYEATVDNGYYGPDLWFKEYKGKSVDKMLIFEKQDGKEDLVPHGAKAYMYIDDKGNGYFRPDSLNPIKLKARWWREPTDFYVDPSGGYFSK